VHVLKPAQLAKDRDLFQRTIRAPRVGSYTGLISDLFVQASMHFQRPMPSIPVTSAS